MTPIAAGTSFDDCLAGIHLDPYPVYAWFRENDPVQRCAQAGPDRPAHWYVFRHKDVETALKDRLLGRRNPLAQEPGPPARAVQGAAGAPGEAGEFARMTSRWMLFKDPPEHDVLRARVARAFTPRMVEKLRPGIETAARRLVEGRGRHGRMDLIADFAFQLPVTVIADLLGLDAEDRARFRDWAQTVVAAIDVKPAPGAIARADVAAVSIDLYLRQVFATRRVRRGDDLVSGLLALEDEGEGLSEEDLVATCMLLALAGQETTTNLIGNGTLALLRDKGEMEKLRADPGLGATAVDELLRYDSPVQFTTRIAQEEHDLAGARVRRGERVHIVLGSANRDGAVFADPDRLDLSRSESPHMSFSLGTHYCLGAALARLEGRIAFQVLLEAFPDLRLAEEAPQWRRDVSLRGLVSLPVEY